MSLSSARAFLDRIMAEEEFSLTLAADLSRKRMELVREAGFEFTDKELEEAKANLAPGALGHVAGWVCQTPLEEPSKRGGCCGGGLWH